MNNDPKDRDGGTQKVGTPIGLGQPTGAQSKGTADWSVPTPVDPEATQVMQKPDQGSQKAAPRMSPGAGQGDSGSGNDGSSQREDSSKKGRGGRWFERVAWAGAVVAALLLGRKCTGNGEEGDSQCVDYKAAPAPSTTLALSDCDKPDAGAPDASDSKEGGDKGKSGLACTTRFGQPNTPEGMEKRKAARDGMIDTLAVVLKSNHSEWNDAQAKAEATRQIDAELSLPLCADSPSKATEAQIMAVDGLEESAARKVASEIDRDPRALTFTREDGTPLSSGYQVAAPRGEIPTPKQKDEAYREVCQVAKKRGNDEIANAQECKNYR